MKTILFTIATERIKYLGINLTKEVKNEDSTGILSSFFSFSISPCFFLLVFQSAILVWLTWLKTSRTLNRYLSKNTYKCPLGITNLICMFNSITQCRLSTNKSHLLCHHISVFYVNREIIMQCRGKCKI